MRGTKTLKETRATTGRKTTGRFNFQPNDTKLGEELTT